MMVLYDYQCLECLHIYEEFAPMDEKSLLKCPACGKIASDRLPSSSIMFKGLPTKKFHSL